MSRVRWIVLIVLGLAMTGLGPWGGLGPSPLAQSAEGSASTSYVLVTLEQLSVDGLDAERSPRLMLGAVAASGPRVRTQTWPDAIWARDPAQRDSFLDGETEAVPLFALPEAEMGERLAFGLVALDNRVSEGANPQDWLNTRMPALVDAASGPVARWGRAEADSISASQERERLEEVIRPHVGPNRQLGILAGRFSAADDWGVREAPYETSVASDGVRVTMRYRIQRVEVPSEGKVNVGLQRLSWTERRTAELFLWTRAATTFSGDGLNALPRRLPLSGAFDLDANSVRSMDTVLIDGRVGPFLYLNVGAWDQSTGRLQARGQLTRFWTAEELLNQRPSDVSLETDSLGLELGLKVPPPTRRSKVYWALPNRIQWAHLDGSNVETVISGLRDLQSVVAPRGRHLYWIDHAETPTTDEERIRRAQLSGANVETLMAFSGNDPGGDLAVDIQNGELYWAHALQTGGSLRRAQLDGSNRQTLVENLNVPTSVALDRSQGHVYWTDVGAALIQRANRNGNSVRTVISSDQAPPLFIDVPSPLNRMVWRDGDMIRQADLDGTNAGNVVAGLQQVGRPGQGIAVFLADSDDRN